jgi:outer membrane beta-barrel protein
MVEWMDSRAKRFFLVTPVRRMRGIAPSRLVILMGTLLAAADGVWGAENQTTEGSKPGAVQVIQPEVQPREVSEAAIDDESFEIGVFAGVINIDNFGSEPLYGVKASYHATEDFFLQINYAVSEAGNTSFEDLSGDNIRLLTDSERDYTYYNALVGYNIFPGEVFMTSSLTFNSAFYLAAGAGNTEFGGEDNFTTTLGTGFRIVLRDWLTWHVDFRDHIFKSDIINENETTHNLELSTGLSLFF